MKLIVNGVQFKSKKSLCEYYGVNINRLNRFISKGFSLEESIHIAKNTIERERYAIDGSSLANLKEITSSL